MKKFEEILMDMYIYTYEQLRTLNNNLKQGCKNTLSIEKISLQLNYVKVRKKKYDRLYGSFNTYESTMSINTLIKQTFLYKDYYITNISCLKNWKGFSNENRVYLSEKLINDLDMIIFDTKFNYTKYKGQYKLCFLTLNRDNIDSFLLRNKLSYNAKCGALGDHFWYIHRKTEKTMILVSDIQIYTPIDSDSLFYKTHFNYIDLNNVNLSYTKNFDRTFANCYASTIDLGSNPNTNACVSLNSMFIDTRFLETIDMRKCNLSKVEDITMFCFNSNVKNVFLNTTITKSLISLKSAIFSTKIVDTNIKNIFSEEQLNIMKDGEGLFVV